MIGTTNAVGGGGGLSESDAVLLVTVPTGSTVTSTKSGKTLTPKLWVQNADNTLDTAIFSIPSSTFDANSWTVTATLNGNTATDTVVINSAKEYKVELSYYTYLFKSGEGALVSFDTKTEAYSSVSVGTDAITCNYTSNSGYQIKCVTSNSIDLTDYSTLNIIGDITEIKTDSSYGGILFVSSSAISSSSLGPSNTSTSYIAKTSVVVGTGAQTVVDVSSLSVSAWVGLKGGIKGSVYYMYLAK